MNRPKPTSIRRPSSTKPSGHPPPGDFIALGSKSQSSEPKANPAILKPASTTLPPDRKREPPSSLPSSSGLSSLSKRPKHSSTPPSALSRLAEVAAVDKRSISPSIKEPSVVPIEVSPAVLLDEIEAAEGEGNDDRIEGVLCGAVKQLKMNRAKPDMTLYLSLMFLAKIKPNVCATEGVIEALCSLLRRDASINFKAKGNNLVSVLACNLLMAAYEEDENWPEIFVKVYIEDSLGERIWVDSSHCKTFVDNIQTAFTTNMPPKSMLLQTDTGRSGGDLSAGNSPHPSTPDEDEGQTELLIAEEKLSPEDDGQIMPRYDELAESVEEYVLEVLKDQLNRRQPMDNVSRNLLRLLTATCGYKEVRLMAIQRLEMWLQNPKLTRPAQDLLMSLCMNCNTHGSDDMEVISNLIKIRLKPKVLLNHYMLCVRELLNAHKDNLGTMVKFVIFNELSNARNPNNMQVLHTLLQHSPEQAPKFLAMVFQDLLTNKDDYLRASRALLREIIKQTKHEINFQSFCLGLMQERKEATYVEMEFKERFVIQVTDLLTVSMMLGITAQVKEAGIAWDKGEKKNLEVLRSFQNQIAAIQRDAVWWLHSVVPTISKVGAKDYVHCLHKVLFTEQPETYYKWDNWPPESERNFFLRLCSEVPLLEDTLMRILVIGLSRDLPLGPADAMELADHLVKRAAGVQSDDLEVLRVERIQLIDAVLNLCTYHHPENIQLPTGYQPPNLAISTLYWKAWLLLLVVAAFNPQKIGLAAWDGYPSLKMLMEMVMTNNYSYPPCTVADEETKTEMINRELQISQKERQEILAFESHLAAASTKQTITESNSLLLSQLTSLDPKGPPRRPPPHILEQVKSLNQSLRLGHLLCRSRSPDFLLNIIQRQASSQSMPWLADLVQSSEGSLDVLPVQCLCEFLLHDAADDAASVDDEEEGESKEQRAKKRQRQQKQRQLLGRLQDLLLGPKADEQTTCEVLDYFLRRLSSSQVASRVLAMKGLSLVLTEGGLRDGEERDQLMEEDSRDAELLPGYQWLLQDLPKLPLFDSVRGLTSSALEQAIHVETDPQTISAYLIYLSQHAPVEEQSHHNDLALDVARLIVERSTIMNSLFSKHSCRPESEAVLSALISIFSTYIRRMRKTKEGEDLYSWSESQDQVFLRWTSGETATMHILVVHAMVILLTLGPPKGESEFYNLLDIWFPDKKPLPTAFLVDTSEEALLLPDWLKLRMIRSEVSRLVDAALQDLEPQQLLLFVQSFGIPVSSMSKLLQYLDQAVSHDPQTLEQNIMDKNYMAHLVEVQHERGATGGHTFHSLLSASLPPRRDSSDVSKAKVTVETPHGSVKMRTVSQVPVIGPDDDLAAILLQLFPLQVDPRWPPPPVRPLALALQQSLAQEVLGARQGHIQQGGAAGRLLQALAALLSSTHAGALVMAMHHSHTISCPLLRQLHLHKPFMSIFGVMNILLVKIFYSLIRVIPSPFVGSPLLKARLNTFYKRPSYNHTADEERGQFLRKAARACLRRATGVKTLALLSMLMTRREDESENTLVTCVLSGSSESKKPGSYSLLKTRIPTGHGISGIFHHFIPFLLAKCLESSVKVVEKSGNLTLSLEAEVSEYLLALKLLRLNVLAFSYISELLKNIFIKMKISRKTNLSLFRIALRSFNLDQTGMSSHYRNIPSLCRKNYNAKLKVNFSIHFMNATKYLPALSRGRDSKSAENRRDTFPNRRLCIKIITPMDYVCSCHPSGNRTTSPSSVIGHCRTLMYFANTLIFSNDSSSEEKLLRKCKYIKLFCGMLMSSPEEVRVNRLYSIDGLIFLFFLINFQSVFRERATYIFGGHLRYKSLKCMQVVHVQWCMRAGSSAAKSADETIHPFNLHGCKRKVSRVYLKLLSMSACANFLCLTRFCNLMWLPYEKIDLTFFLLYLPGLSEMKILLKNADKINGGQELCCAFLSIILNSGKLSLYRLLCPFDVFLQSISNLATLNFPARIACMRKSGSCVPSIAGEDGSTGMQMFIYHLDVPVLPGSSAIHIEHTYYRPPVFTSAFCVVKLGKSIALTTQMSVKCINVLKTGKVICDLIPNLTAHVLSRRCLLEGIRCESRDLARGLSPASKLCFTLKFENNLKMIFFFMCLVMLFDFPFLWILNSAGYHSVRGTVNNLSSPVSNMQEIGYIFLFKSILVVCFNGISCGGFLTLSMCILYLLCI
ncbi:Integrator complex subunit 1 [Triplophysa tibetana]|uniref:Integrator complex subunit 1 n=1 Tax=Triplophysa tibetana TaxID=1572043 RepID=A0A5A9N8Y1_9TELE|nr:Integrator complex subunit 1 [Triplophysa tibetana]